MTSISTQRERIDMRVDSDTKRLAERATAVCGYSSVTEFITSLIRENAPKVLQEHKSLCLTGEEFDRFIEICNDAERKPGKRILDTAKRLDAEGF